MLTESCEFFFLHPGETFQYGNRLYIRCLGKGELGKIFLPGLNGIDEINDQLFGSSKGTGSGSVVTDDGYTYTPYVDSNINYGVESTTIPDTGIVD